MSGAEPGKIRFPGKGWKNMESLWLAADPDPATRAHGFYRSGGWRPTGQLDARGDEILQLHDLD